MTPKTTRESCPFYAVVLGDCTHGSEASTGGLSESKGESPAESSTCLQPGISDGIQELTEVNFQLQRGMATEPHYGNFIYRAARFPVLWAARLVSCISFGGFARICVFLFPNSFGLEGCLASLHSEDWWKPQEFSESQNGRLVGPFTWLSERPPSGGSGLGRATGNPNFICRGNARFGGSPPVLSAVHLEAGLYLWHPASANWFLSR